MKRTIFLMGIVAACTYALPAHAQEPLLKREVSAWSLTRSFDALVTDIEHVLSTYHATGALLPAIAAPVAITGDSSDDVTEFLTLSLDGRSLSFRDVPLRAWYTPSVRSVIVEGLLRGYGEPSGAPRGLFGPGDPLTLAQLSHVLLKALKRDLSLCPERSDNPSARDTWADATIACSEYWKFPIVSSRGTDVHRPALRGEVLLILLTSFGIAPELSSTVAFRDVPPTHPAAGFIARATKDGLIRGIVDPATGRALNRFEPGRTINRAEFSKLITDALTLYRSRR